MKSALLFVLLVVALVAANPSYDAHLRLLSARVETLIRQAHPIRSALVGGIGGVVGADPVGAVAENMLKGLRCQSYVIASACHLRGVLTVGALGHVWLIGDIELRPRREGDL